ncbi:MAG: Crp/Fnr family transcriptional regulator [Bacteroidales bacterium]|nr:Crp/Fnr family transcriptional regulator [Bacteroidales bacterium]
MSQYSKDLNCVNCPFKLSLFQHLSKEELTYLDENRYEVHFNTGETIFKQGGALTHIASLTRGLFKIYLEDKNKNNLLLRLLKPTELVGGPGFMVDSRHHFSVTALENSTVCFVDIKAFEEIIRQNSDFALQFIGYLNAIHINIYDKLISLTHKNMHGRVADTLIYLSKNIYESSNFETPLSRQDLADLSSLAKESFIRILKEFKDSGMIHFEGNSFHIKNHEALQKISQIS